MDDSTPINEIYSIPHIAELRQVRDVCLDAAMWDPTKELAFRIAQLELDEAIEALR